MRIAITGASGMIGQKLTAYFRDQGHQVFAVVRRSSPSFDGPVIQWEPSEDYIEAEKLEGFDVIINLAGASIAQPWTSAHKKAILDSRVDSTKLLAASLARLASKPKLLISASAIGFYGSLDHLELVDENAKPGEGFLADVCQQWEEATLAAAHAGIRVVRMRLGVVLSRNGGALDKMWKPFQLGLGGRLGNGEQVMSWIALDEIPYIVEHLINSDVQGPVNAVTPDAVTNAKFTQILGEVIHRPTVFPVPAAAVRLMFGEMGQKLLLEGAHVVPRRLHESDYKFRYAQLKEALTNICHSRESGNLTGK